jgi:predicted MFS family arabinose efflux permease
VEWVGYLLLNASWAALPLKIYEIGNGFDYGLQGSINGIGIFLASLVYMRLIKKFNLNTERAYLLSWLGYAVCELFLALSTNVLIFMLVTLFLGLINTPRNNLRTLLIQENTEVQHAGKVFSSFYTVQNFSNMLMFLLGALIADSHSPTLVMAGASILLIALLLLIGGPSFVSAREK